MMTVSFLLLLLVLPAVIGATVFVTRRGGGPSDRDRP